MTEKQPSLTITKWQWFTILATNLINVQIILVPRVVSQIAEQDAWITYFLAGLFALVVGYGYLWISQRFPGKNLYQYTPVIYGKYLGFLFNLIILSYTIAITGITLRFFSESIKLFWLPKTPQWVILISFILVGIYLAQKGIVTIAKVMDILFVIIITGVLLLTLFPLVRANLGNLLPIMPEGLWRVIKPIPLALQTYFIFGPIGFMAPYSRDKKVTFQVLGALVLSIIANTSLTITMQAYFGPHALNRLKYPLLEMAKGIVFPGSLLERIEIIFFTTLIPIAFAAIATYLYIFITGLKNIFPVLKNQASKWISIMLSIIIASIPANSDVNYMYFLYISIIPLFLASIYTPVSIIVILIRGLKEK